MLKSELFRGLTDTVQTLPVSHTGNHIFYIVDPNFQRSVLCLCLGLGPFSLNANFTNVFKHSMASLALLQIFHR